MVQHWGSRGRLPHCQCQVPALLLMLLPSLLLLLLPLRVLPQLLLAEQLLKLIPHFVEVKKAPSCFKEPPEMTLR